MTEQQTLGPISPFFIVLDVPRAVEFYTQKLGFEVRFSDPETPFFSIVGRDSVQILLKDVSDKVGPQVGPEPNHTRHEWAPWDDALAPEPPPGGGPASPWCAVLLA